jgi:hypothetical protein
VPCSGDGDPNYTCVCYDDCPQGDAVCSCWGDPDMSCGEDQYVDCVDGEFTCVDNDPPNCDPGCGSGCGGGGGGGCDVGCCDPQTCNCLEDPPQCDGFDEANFVNPRLDSYSGPVFGAFLIVPFVFKRRKRNNEHDRNGLGA